MRFVPTPIVREQLAGPAPGRVCGAYWDGSILFADLSGFTALSGMLSALGKQGAVAFSALQTRAGTVLFANFLPFSSALDILGDDTVTATQVLNAYYRRAQEVIQHYGGIVNKSDKIAAWPELLIVFPLYLIAFGPLGEEPGWRAFALPRLQPDRSPLARTLILGVLIVVWHLPLVASGQQPAVTLLATLAAQIIYTWLANHVNGSVLIVMLAHAAQGGLGGEYFGPMFSGADATLQTWLLAALYLAVAVLVIALAGPSLARKPAVQPEAIGQPLTAG